MRISDQAIETFKKQGYVVIENFLTKEEKTSALEGFYQYFAPPYETFIKNGNKNDTIQQSLFPWDHSGLNHAITHPDLIDAAERIMGTREIRLSEAHLGMKYYQAKTPTSTPGEFHEDYWNNTLGPRQYPDDFQHIYFFYCFDDVKPGMAPILIVPNGKSDGGAEEIIVPGGSVAIYSIFTRHAASEFTKPGHRPASWVGFSRKDRPWDGGRSFTYKGGATVKGMARFIVEASPRDLELIGFPPPGDLLWTEDFLQGMVKRYHGFNPEPYLNARIYK